MSESPQSQGNGCLYTIGAFGVLCVVAGVLWGQVPNLLEDLVAEDEPPVPRGLDVPPPPPAPPIVDPVAEPIPAPPPIDPTEGLETEPIVWHAEVLYHPELGEGVDCVVTLGMNRRLDGPAPITATVQCAERVLFEGLVGRQDVSEMSLGPRGYAYRADVSAMGRADWAQHSLSFSSRSRRAAITAPGQTLELYVDDLSVPRRGDAFFVANETNPARGFAPVRRVARVRNVDGVAPAGLANAPSDGCQLSVRPAIDSTFNCRVVLRCGAAMIYGAGTSGYNQCSVADGVLLGARDEGTSIVDTDPDIDLDLPSQSIIVIDDGPDGRWTARLDLATEPSCSEASTYEGPLVGEDGRARLENRVDAWMLTLPNQEPMMLEELPSNRCETGDLILRGASGDLVLSLGVEGRTYAGTWAPFEGSPVAVLLERI